ncbi:MAG: 5-formyltetrahydrofolate cyclo-ligase [Candidatus Latescibacterota bacterium]
MQEEKKALRRLIRSRRAEMDAETFRTMSAAIERRCVDLPEVQSAGTIHIYVSAVNNEVHTHGLILLLLDWGKRVVVPRCASEPARLHHICINSLEELKPSRFGLLEPEHIPESEVEPADLDLVIAPLLAFDRSGARLGFGGGYYDYLFRRCVCTKIGLAYSFQEMERIPFEPHDRKLDIIVTEKETIRFR